MNKKGTQVKKGYFFFDDELVALGSGINSTEEDQYPYNIKSMRS